MKSNTGIRSEKQAAEKLQNSNNNSARQRKPCFVYLQAEGVEIPESWLSPAEEIDHQGELQSREEVRSAALSNSKRLYKAFQKKDAQKLRQSKMVSVSNGSDDHIDLLSSASKSDAETPDETTLRAAMCTYSSDEMVHVDSERGDCAEIGNHLLAEVQMITSPMARVHPEVGDSVASPGSECKISAAQPRLASSPASRQLSSPRKAGRHQQASAAVSAHDPRLGGAPLAALDVVVAEEGLPPPLPDDAEEDRNPLGLAMPPPCTAGPPPSSPRVVLVQSVLLPPDGGAEREAPAPSFTAAILDSASAVTALADAAAGAMAAAGKQAAAALPPWLADLVRGRATADPAACAVWRDADWAAGAGTLFLDGVALRVREGTVHLDGVAVAQPDQPDQPGQPDPAHGLLGCRCARRLLIACPPPDAAAAAGVAAGEWATVCRDCGRWTAGPAGAEPACDVEVLF